MGFLGAPCQKYAVLGLVVMICFSSTGYFTGARVNQTLQRGREAPSLCRRSESCSCLQLWMLFRLPKSWVWMKVILRVSVRINLL